MRILVTGATGKVGRTFISAFLADPRWSDVAVVVLYCHNRSLPPQSRLEEVRGSIGNADVVRQAMAGVTHVFHMATSKEDPDSFIDVSMRGTYNLLEAFRHNPDARQFVLIGGDCVVGHCFVCYDAPVTETSRRRAYPGVYALSKVLEEEMVEQFGIQYGLNWTTLRAPWIMEKDDFRYALSFGPDQFGGPDWDTLIPREERQRYAAEDRTPLLIDSDGAPLRRNFVHLSDLVAAMLSAIDHPAARQQLFNIAMTQAVDYGTVALQLEATRSMPPARVQTPYHSNLLDNGKARLRLGWTPKVDTRALVEMAFGYQRAADDPRKVWYPG